MNIKQTKAFTLTELMIVVVIVGITATFAIPSYTKSIARSHQRDMVTQLQTLHASNLIYRAQAGTYWDTGGTAETALATINSTLGINIIANDGTTYSYNSADGSAFTATAAWGGFIVSVDEGAIVAGTNPSCSGSCP